MGCSNSSTISNSKILKKKRSSKSIKMFKKEIADFKANYQIMDLVTNSGKIKLTQVKHLPTNQIRLCKQIFKSHIVGPTNINEKTDELLAHLCEIDDHPSIPKIFEYFEDEISYYVILEMALGKELLNYIEHIDNFTERQVAIIMEQLFSALNYLHENDIIHCNVMPENIILDSEKIGNYYIKLVNFEKASVVKAENEEDFKNKKAKLEGVKYGHCYFLSPDRLVGKRDFKDDLWSCGIIMYILLCGYPPFISEHAETLISKIKKGKFNFLEKDWSNISKEAKHLIEQLLHINPKKRIDAISALNHPWIIKHLKNRNKETEKKVKESNLQINTKIRKFSHMHSFEIAVMAFIVRHTSTNNQANQLRDIFRLMDTNREGRLTYEELSNGYQRFFAKSTLSKEEYMEIVKSFDRDGSEYVEFEEFLTAFMKSELILTEKNLRFAFDYFDEDKSGNLSGDEIKRILSFNNCYDDDKIDIDDLIKSYDKDSDGQISFDEFLSLMKKLLVM